MADLPLHCVRDRAIRSIWPFRSQQGLLLDLVERKGWDRDDYSATVGRVSAWLANPRVLVTDTFRAPLLGGVVPNELSSLDVALLAPVENDEGTGGSRQVGGHGFEHSSVTTIGQWSSRSCRSKNSGW